MIWRRGYLWLTAVLATALLIVILIGLHPKPSATIPIEAPPPLPNQPSRIEWAKADNQPSKEKAFHHHNLNTKTKQKDLHQTTPPTSTARKIESLMFNLNSADSADLVKLYNIGPAFARRIIRYRTLLGGYVDKTQLMEVYGMDSVRYSDIAPHLYVNSDAVTTFDLNVATSDQLKRHPYLDHHQAEAIVRLRETTGPYNDPHEILEIPIIDHQTFIKIEPYLTCSSQSNK